MIHHDFIFSPGVWIGEGIVTFSASPDKIKFYTKWEVQAQEPNETGSIYCVQQVQLQGVSDKLENQLCFSLINPKEFVVQLDNSMMEKIKGTGIKDDKTIAWEFRGYPNFEGFEVYQLQENGEYIFHSEYVSPPELYRTIIHGKIWKKIHT